MLSTVPMPSHHTHCRETLGLTQVYSEQLSSKHCGRIGSRPNSYEKLKTLKYLGYELTNKNSIHGEIKMYT
jgi:hypothetical protein